MTHDFIILDDLVVPDGYPSPEFTEQMPTFVWLCTKWRMGSILDEGENG